jgi:hypothetical protein
MRLVFLALALMLALPAVAAAKEVESARVCGATECRDVDDHDVAMGLVSGGNAKPPPGDKAGGWYRVSVVFNAEGERHGFTMAAMPSSQTLRTYDESTGRYSWMEMAGEAIAAYDKVTPGLEPRPISTLRGRDQKPPEVIVDEVVMPPAEPAAQTAGTFPWEWVAGGVAAAALASGAALLALRRRRGSAPPHAGPQAAG